jgi:ribonuclease E
MESIELELCIYEPPHLKMSHMSDRWKSLAEQLGAPGLDPTVRRPKESSTTKPDTGSARSPSSEPADTRGADKASGRPDHSQSDDSPPPTRSAESAADSSAADISAADITGQEWLQKEPSASGTVSPTASERDTPHSKGPAQATTGAISQPEPPAGKPKRRSNWERLANLFSLSADTRSERESQTTTSPDSAIDMSASDSSNPVLTEMFGTSDSSLPHESWQSPKRMVDDVGLEDDQEVSPYRKAHSEAESGTTDPLSSDWLKEGKSSRGRFKRGRDRQSEPGFPSGQLPDAKRETGREDSPDSPRADSSRADIEPRRAETADEVDEEFIAERRSSRRRRPRREATDNPEALGFEREQSRPRPSREEKSVDLDAVDENLSELGEEVSEESLAEVPAKRRRRRRRSRSARRDSESGEISPAAESAELADEAIDESDDLDSDDLDIDSNQLDSDDVDSEQLDSEPRGSQKKHRNIPSWEESLAAIVDANLENHRRGDQRGYRGGGGRPRGRR